ncbi:TfuA-like protein [Amycolatopsis panacis]|uniref:TfuA-like core domain-containing protein n=1 Tax=Amycolatopsis panacis TaxID=2340917 RepID=A0A419HXK1_9PSEU|nr:TfuA-like protein [Amycolatopsis panacis]RJQ81872.1 hypothetical protein D5S19_22795 [Amycolatopsis panacis]
MPVHVFLGPTLPGPEALNCLPGAVLHPPVAHGDLLRHGFTRGDVVVLVDGFYHQSASVRHKEILALLQSGVRVVGCASMGAIRAAELHRYGMLGHGVVFGQYRDELLEGDDEVAVLHGEAPEYRKLTVALVAVRHAAEAARRAGVLSAAAAQSVVELARHRHYTERTWQSLASAGEDLVRLRDFLAEHPEAADVKAADTRNTLRALARGVLPGAGGVGDGAADEGCAADVEAADARGTVPGAGGVADEGFVAGVEAVDARGMVSGAGSVAGVTDEGWVAGAKAADLRDTVPGTSGPRDGTADEDCPADATVADTRDTLPGRGGPGDWTANDDWRNRFITEWQVEFSVSPVEGTDVSLGATIRYQQIHLEDFPARWRRYVLGHLAGPGPEDEREVRALRVAARHGLSPESLTAEQTGYWLTPAEAAELPGKEALLRILVRSYQPQCPTSDLASAEPGVGADPAARRAVAEAEVVNAEVASWASGQHVGQLKPAVLTEHLASVWRTGDEPALLAAARDRGFATVAEAAEAVRPFFLRSRFLTRDGA